MVSYKAANGEPWYEPTYHGIIVVTGMATMVTSILPWYHICMPVVYHGITVVTGMAAMVRNALPWYTMVNQQLCTTVYHGTPWYTAVYLWYTTTLPW